MRSATLYIEPQTSRDCGVAAQLLGLDSGDAFAEMVLRERLDAMPEVAELRGQISYAVKKARDAWQTKHAQAKTPGQQASAEIRAATT